MGARLLLIDDSGTIRKELRSVLEDALKVDEWFEAEDGLQGFKAMVEHRPDLVLCDLVMPVFDGLKFLGLRATRAELGEIPVIMLTGESNQDRKVEVLDRGASDYITKPFNAKELVARVRVHYRVKMLQDALRQTNLRLEELATTDGLTGLFNRRYLDSLLQNELLRALRYRTPLSVILVDLDHFKSVNDTYGHAMGDLVLCNIGRCIAGCVRAVDSIARYGGEELAIVLPQTAAAGAAQLGERLRQKVAGYAHEHEGRTVRVTASFGVASHDGQDEPIGPEELLKRADAALYEAKGTGRNRVVVHG